MPRDFSDDGPCHLMTPICCDLLFYLGPNLLAHEEIISEDQMLVVGHSRVHFKCTGLIIDRKNCVRLSFADLKALCVRFSSV